MSIRVIVERIGQGGRTQEVICSAELDDRDTIVYRLLVLASDSQLPLVAVPFTAADRWVQIAPDPFDDELDGD